MRVGSALSSRGLAWGEWGPARDGGGRQGERRSLLPAPCGFVEQAGAEVLVGVILTLLQEPINAPLQVIPGPCIDVIASGPILQILRGRADGGPKPEVEACWQLG